jgi:hypothetical protein
MVCCCQDWYRMIDDNVALPTIKESPLLNEGFVHQNVNVPGPVTVVCKVDVAEEYTSPLVAAETPSWVVVVSEYQPPYCPLVVQVRFVVLRAWANVCPRTTDGVITKAVIRASSPKHCAGFKATWGTESWLLVLLILFCIVPDSA